MMRFVVVRLGYVGGVTERIGLDLFYPFDAILFGCSPSDVGAS